MASESPIYESHNWFTGKKRLFSFEILDSNDNPIDISTGYTFKWVFTPSPVDSTAIIEKTSSEGITIAGSYNSIRASNTQRVIVTVDAADTSEEVGRRGWHELSRTDTGSEDVFAFGLAVLRQSVTA